ncbi:hypothetical protein [Sciscionella marina]|uniref:hypothetical protein n=1 Tax=Sciscionella marina TaxID=508770 RepID=UPI000381FDAD|nr:hypothetical protein [Sciscionella marina]
MHRSRKIRHIGRDSSRQHENEDDSDEEQARLREPVVADTVARREREAHDRGENDGHQHDALPSHGKLRGGRTIGGDEEDRHEVPEIRLRGFRINRIISQMNPIQLTAKKTIEGTLIV